MSRTKVPEVAPPPNLLTAARPILERLQREPPIKRIRMAFTLMEQLTQLMAEMATVRRGAVRELRKDNWTLAAIAEGADISVTRVKQIEEDPPQVSPEDKAAKAAERKAARERVAQERIDAAVRAALEDAGRGE